MSPLSLNQSKLNAAINRLQQLAPSQVALFLHSRTLKAHYETQAALHLSYLTNTNVDHEHPDNSLSMILAIARSDGFADLVGLKLAVDLLNGPELVEAERVAGPILAEIEELKAAVQDDQRRVDHAKSELEVRKLALVEAALAAAENDPSLAALQAEIDRCEAVCAGAVAPCPVEAERRAKAEAATAPARRRAERLAIEALAD